jgi:hypothetical protein
VLFLRRGNLLLGMNTFLLSFSTMTSEAMTELSSEPKVEVDTAIF